MDTPIIRTPAYVTLPDLLLSSRYEYHVLFQESFFSPYVGGLLTVETGIGTIATHMPADPEGKFLASREGNNHQRKQQHSFH